MTNHGHCATKEAEAQLARVLSSSAPVDALLRTFSGAVRIAHEVEPGAWRVTMTDDAVRLVVGTLEAFSLLRDGARFLVRRGTGGTSLRVRREPQKLGGAEEAELLVANHLGAVAAFPPHADEYRFALERACARATHHARSVNGTGSAPHARGLLSHIEDRLETGLPRPEWDHGPSWRNGYETVHRAGRTVASMRTAG